jgi:hypothetical protein
MDMNTSHSTSGILPVRPFTTEFVGMIQGDGQMARVAAIACQPDGVVLCLSMVGFDTTLAAIAARIFKGSGADVSFCPANEAVWEASQRLQRDPHGRYHQTSAAILHTRERHMIVLIERASIAEGVLSPHEPQLPDHVPPLAGCRPAVASRTVAWPRRIIFANAHEERPSPWAFLGHLRAVSVVFLPHWAALLWIAGLHDGLIAPLPALGIRAWQIDGDPDHWTTLVRDALRDGRLPLSA